MCIFKYMDVIEGRPLLLLLQELLDLEVLFSPKWMWWSVSWLISLPDPGDGRLFRQQAAIPAFMAFILMAKLT